VKRYQFRLEPVLRVRRIEEDLAVAALAASQREAAAAEARLANRLESYRSRSRPLGIQTLATFAADRALAETAAASVVAAGAVRRSALEHVDEKRHAWSQAAARVSALERLDDRKRDEHAHEAQREADLEVDDLVTSRRRHASQVGDR
jgi:flagellar export protein FliJ